MSESFTDIEEVIRCLAEDIHPSVSLRQRILKASYIARERQRNRIRVRRISCWSLICLGVIFAGAQVQRNYFQTFGRPNASELLASRARAIKDSLGSIGSAQAPVEVSQAEVPSTVVSDLIEWETADSHWKRRDRQAALISHCF